MTSLVSIPERPEHTMRVAEERVRAVELHHISLVQHHDPVAVNDGVQAMGDGKHSTVFEADPHQSLDQFVSFVVNTCRGFIKNKDLRLAQ